MVHGAEEDLREFSDLLEILKHKAGRILSTVIRPALRFVTLWFMAGPIPRAQTAATLRWVRRQYFVLLVLSVIRIFRIRRCLLN